MFFVNSRFLTQQITGVQRYAIEISRKIKHLYPEAKFISPKNVIHNDISTYLEAETSGNLSGHLWEQLELPLFLRQVKSRLLVNLANTAPLLYKNQFITIHDLAFLRNPKWFSIKASIYYRLLIPALARRAQKIITVSEFSKSEIMHLLNIPDHKISVVYNGISEELCKNRDIEFRKNNNEYGNYVLALSSSDPRKNIKKLISAYRKLNLGDTKLILAGGENRIFAKNESMKEIIRSDDNIIDVGYVSDSKLMNLYSNAKLFIYPSLYEGFGLPPLEAMAAGCPVLVSNTASLPEVCGEAACYVDPYKVDSIAEGIYQVMTNEGLRQSLIHKGFEKVKLYSWEKSAKEHIKILEEVM